MLKPLTMALALAAATTTPAMAAPSDYRAAVAEAGRAPKDVALDASRKPAEVLDFLGLKRDMAALDVMAGGGYYTQIMSRAVGPNGSVTVFEPKQFYEEPANKSNWDALVGSHRNVRLMAVPLDGLSFPANSYDFVMMHLTYHDFYWESAKYQFPRMDPDAVLRNLYAATKPGGIVAVIDHAAALGDTRQTVENLHRIDPAVVKADFERAGFMLEAESKLLAVPEDDHTKSVFDPAVRGKTDRFVMKFRKKA